VVTDVGAPLSHAAIVARELGIPAVVGCGNATMRLNGDRSVEGAGTRVRRDDWSRAPRSELRRPLVERRPERLAHDLGSVATGERWSPPTLLGAVLRSGEVAVRLTEVEAYDGASDPASHAFRGRTPRNAVMFGRPGHLYIYFSYGIHWNANVVCGPEGAASGVLLRAGEVIDGVEFARARRGPLGRSGSGPGPGRLCQALGLTRDHGGADLFGGGPVCLEPGEPPAMIMVGPRVGVSVEGRPAVAVLGGRQPVRVQLQAQPAGSHASD
jgi:DNA-3-methyladenine glycosylase